MIQRLSINKILRSALAVLMMGQMALGVPTVLAASGCFNVAGAEPANVDMNKVREAWLTWYNNVRAANGLKPFVYNDLLNDTATNWSLYSKKKGSIDHKRAGQKSYYDYKKVGAWFAAKGVTFANTGGRSDYVENIGWDYYKCSAADCTDELIASIKHTYSFIMGEKGKKYKPHYDSIMNKYYHVIGLGIAVDTVKKRYYLTVHYGTAVEEKQSMACGSARESAQVSHKF